MGESGEALHPRSLRESEIPRHGTRALMPLMDVKLLTARPRVGLRPRLLRLWPDHPAHRHSSRRRLGLRRCPGQRDHPHQQPNQVHHCFQQKPRRRGTRHRTPQDMANAQRRRPVPSVDTKLSKHATSSSPWQLVNKLSGFCCRHRSARTRAGPRYAHWPTAGGAPGLRHAGEATPQGSRSDTPVERTIQRSADSSDAWKLRHRVQMPTLDYAHRLARLRFAGPATAGVLVPLASHDTGEVTHPWQRLPA
jgi:hypothetical protein